VGTGAIGVMPTYNLCGFDMVLLGSHVIMCMCVNVSCIDYM
jgi:hypothetical protein